MSLRAGLFAALMFAAVPAANAAAIITFDESNGGLSTGETLFSSFDSMAAVHLSSTDPAVEVDNLGVAAVGVAEELGTWAMILLGFSLLGWLMSGQRGTGFRDASLLTDYNEVFQPVRDHIPSVLQSDDTALDRVAA